MDKIVALDTGRRRGGRNARHEARRQSLPENIRPVRGGLSGGAYKPLSLEDCQKIHEAALDALETIGLGDAIPSCIDIITKAGGYLNDRGRLIFPRALVEDTLAMANRDFVLYGQDPKHDISPHADRVYFGTGGAAVSVVDPDTWEYQDSSVSDLYDFARLVDKLDNIHFFQRCAVARDITDPFDMDLNSCYASVAGTTKHIGSSWMAPEQLEKSLEMLHIIAGGEENWRARPFVSISCCFVVPPMKFAEDACQCLEVGVRGGMPVLLLSAAQAGATSPSALAGSIVQAVAEVLAGLAYVNAIRPGAPAIFGTWPFVSDLRTGAMSGGSPEQALLSAGCAQMASFYGLTGGVCAGMTDSKIPDVQHGFEKGYTEALVGHSSANLVYESAGMQASLLGCSKEAMVLDNDLIGSVLRTVRGIEVNDETLSLDIMRNVCLEGPNHYLGHKQTIGLMQSEYYYPDTGERSSPNQWNEKGKPTALDIARKKTEEILNTHYPRHISDETDAIIRQKFNILWDR